MTRLAFELKGRVEAVLVAANFGSILSTSVPKIQLIRGHGVRGDNHAGVRLAEVAQAMNLSKPVPHGCLGENLVLSGIPRLTELPAGTMLFFRKDEKRIRTAVLMVWAENTPCQGPGEAIQEKFPEIPRLALLFPKSAIGKRGIVGSIYASGNIHAGDTVVAKVPRQRIYNPE